MNLFVQSAFCKKILPGFGGLSNSICQFCPQKQYIVKRFKTYLQPHFCYQKNILGLRLNFKTLTNVFMVYLGK